MLLLPTATYVKIKAPRGKIYFARVLGIEKVQGVRIRRPFKTASGALEYACRIVDRYKRLRDANQDRS